MKASCLRGTFAGFCVYAMLSSPAWSNDSVKIPGYAPATGVQHSYRVQKATETDMSFWFGNAGAASVTSRGEFRQHMTTLSRDDKGMQVRWSLDGALPGDAVGAADTYQMNLLYRNSLAAYGVGALELETDLNGYPRNLFGVDQILANMRKMAANGPGGAPAAPESGVYDIINRIQENPIQIVTVLVPEAQLLARGQSYQDETMEAGRPLAVSRNEDYGDVSVPVTSTWILESTDAASRTATVSLSEDYDPAAFSQSQQAAIAKLMVGFAERVKSLTPDQLASVKRASKNRSAKFVVSLNDGSTIEASEVVTATTGGSTFRTYTHILREDMPASLQLPAILTAKVLQTPDLQIEPLSSTAAATGDDHGKAIEPILLDVKSAKVVSAATSFGFELDIGLTPESAAKFRDFTQAAIGRQTQVLIDDKVVMEPWLREPIMDCRIVIAGADRKDLDALAKQLAVPETSILVRARP